MDFDRIFNPTIQEQIEDLEGSINTLKVLYNERCAFCRNHSNNDGECKIFGIIVRPRCLLYNPDYKSYETILKALAKYMEQSKKYGWKCPEEGEFYGYKFVGIDKVITRKQIFDIGIAKLKIPGDSKRVCSIWS